MTTATIFMLGLGTGFILAAAICLCDGLVNKPDLHDRECERDALAAKLHEYEKRYGELND